MATFTCLVCGATFQAKNNRTHPRKYCSRKCFFEARTGMERPDMRGRKAWNAGLTADNDARIAAVTKAKLKNVVDRETLYQLYVVENLSLKAIGQRYGVGKTVIRRLTEEFGFARKRDQLTQDVLQELYAEGKTTTDIGEMFNCTNTFVGNLARQFGIKLKRQRNQAGIKPDPETLRQMYWAEWLSYEAIAERLGVDFTSIPYWLKKFDIPKRDAWQTRRGPNWQEPDIEVITHLYEAETMGTQSIADLHDGTSKAYIAGLLKTAGVKLRESGYPNVSRYTAKDGHRVKSSLELQVDDWLYEHGIDHTYEPAIGTSKYKADFLVGDTYIEIWGIMGNAKYQAKQQKKLEAYHHFGLKLLSVYRKDFPHLHVLDVLSSTPLELLGR